MFKTFRKLLQNHSAHIWKLQQHTQAEVPIFINGKPVSVPSYFTILQALRRERVVTPTFCYHDRLTIAGNCRMCLIEVEGWPKLQIACGIPVAKGMKIRTHSEVVMRAREAVVEFILADHPLDCPVCDQGGECDLQDITMRFGNDRSRFTEIKFDGKRAVEDNDLGPLIRTSMNRCIHCTRCIRFGSQIAGIDVLGTTGRGHDMLVGTYIDKMFLSEVSGNIIDLCPVGALTNGPSMFRARAWELSRTNSIDVTDATGTNIEIDHRFNKVIRILPREHDEVNQEWLSDKGRWAVDSTEIQRLVTPMVLAGNCLAGVEWDCALYTAAWLIQRGGGSLAVIAGPHTNAETLMASKDLLSFYNSNCCFISRSLQNAPTASDVRFAYSLNIPMKDIPSADVIVLVGTNPRFEAPILNVWIRQAYLRNDADIYVIGPRCEYNYHVNYLGCMRADIRRLGPLLDRAKKPLIFVGMSVLESPAAAITYHDLLKFEKWDKSWPIVNTIPLDASHCTALELGYKPCGLEFLLTSPPKVLISLGNDEILNYWKPTVTDLIYVGFQGDLGAQYAKVVLPGCAYTEAGGTFMNMENRAQMALPAVTPPGKARPDWKIIRALAEYCGVCLPYDDPQGIRGRLVQQSPAFAMLDVRQGPGCIDLLKKWPPPMPPNAEEMIDVDLKTLKDYYCTDVFSCNSPTMVRALKAAYKYDQSKYAKN